MDDIDLEALYKQSQSEGLIETVQTTSGDSVDLESLYEDSKKGLVSEAPQQAQIQPVAKPSIDVMSSVKKGAQAALTPNPQQMGMGGLDVAQRFGQTALQDIYGQGRSLIQQGTPQNVARNVGRVITSTLPGGAMLSPKIQETVGREGVGVGLDIGSGLAIAGAMKAGGSISKIRLPDIKELFTSTKSLKNVAIQANRSLNRARNTFTNSYSELMDKSGDKIVPSELKSNLGRVVSDASQQTAPGSAINKYMSDDLFSTLTGGNINMRDLHALKGKLFKQAKSAIGVEKNALMKVYDEINKTLSNETLGGAKYANLTSEYESFLRNEVGYIDKLIKDAQKNVTEAKLGKRGMLGIGRPANLTENQREAFKRLSNRSTSTMNLLGELDNIRRRELLVRGAVALGGTLLPGARGAGRTAQYVVERS